MPWYPPVHRRRRRRHTGSPWGRPGPCRETAGRLLGFAFEAQGAVLQLAAVVAPQGAPGLGVPAAYREEVRGGCQELVQAANGCVPRARGGSSPAGKGAEGRMGAGAEGGESRELGKGAGSGVGAEEAAEVGDRMAGTGDTGRPDIEGVALRN